MAGSDTCHFLLGWFENMEWELTSGEETRRVLLHLYENHLHHLWWTANEIVKDELYAQDIVHDVFEYLLKRGVIVGTPVQIQ